MRKGWNAARNRVYDAIFDAMSDDPDGHGGKISTFVHMYAVGNPTVDAAAVFDSLASPAADRGVLQFIYAQVAHKGGHAVAVVPRDMPPRFEAWLRAWLRSYLVNPDYRSANARTAFLQFYNDHCRADNRILGFKLAAHRIRSKAPTGPNRSGVLKVQKISAGMASGVLKISAGMASEATATFNEAIVRSNALKQSNKKAVRVDPQRDARDATDLEAQHASTTASVAPLAGQKRPLLAHRKAKVPYGQTADGDGDDDDDENKDGDDVGEDSGDTMGPN